MALVRVIALFLAFALLNATALEAQYSAAPVGVRRSVNDWGRLTHSPGDSQGPTLESEGALRTSGFVIGGALVGAIVGGFFGWYLSERDCSQTSCEGYNSIRRVPAAIRGALVGIPLGGLLGYILSKGTDPKDASELQPPNESLQLPSDRRKRLRRNGYSSLATELWRYMATDIS